MDLDNEPDERYERIDEAVIEALNQVVAKLSSDEEVVEKKVHKEEERVNERDAKLDVKNMEQEAEHAFLGININEIPDEEVDE